VNTKGAVQDTPELRGQIEDFAYEAVCKYEDDNGVDTVQLYRTLVMEFDLEGVYSLEEYATRVAEEAGVAYEANGMMHDGEDEDA